MKLIFNENKPMRLDKFLVAQNLKQLYSRSLIDKLIANGDIRVNGKTVKKSHLLKNGEEIAIIIPQPQKFEIIPENIPLDIVYEDDYLAIVNKPAGLTVHPAPGNYRGTLVNALVFHLGKHLSSGGDYFRPGIVHRLDKDTSGLVVVAKNDEIHYLLSQMFQNRRIEKYYLAITVGIPHSPKNEIRSYLNRSKSDRKKMAVSEKGKIAITNFEILEEFVYFALIKIRLHTGRTHQIRVHFSHINAPILGDQTYSGLKRTLNSIPGQFHKKVKFLLAKHLTRQALHAHKLVFSHPITKEKINVEIPLPEDMNYALKWLRTNFSIDD